MPFTVSHASAIIPFHRKPYVLSAMIAGSMSPDFLYYIPFVTNYDFTHSIAGLFVFCLPSSLLLLFVYHRFIKKPLIALLPQRWQGSLWHITRNFRFFPASQFGFVSLSILLGAATHILWDSFTHEGHADQFWPWLDLTVFTVFGKTIAIYKLLQYASSVLGLLVFIVWFARLVWRQQSKATRMAYPNFSGVPPLLAMLATSLAFGFGLGFDNLYYSTVRNFVVQTTVASMSAFFVLLVIYSCFWHRKFKQ